LAGQVGVVGHIEVGDRVIVGAQSGVTRNIKSDITILGSPAQEVNKMRKIYVYERKLEDMEKRISELEKLLKQSKQ
jgi:UDP-3-O-[3-hydroxymyristoyl] glucosamine N-acyltransferase